MKVVFLNFSVEEELDDDDDNAVSDSATAARGDTSAEFVSDGEFEDDPLLVLLRQQRSQYLEQLRFASSALFLEMGIPGILNFNI